MHGLADSKTDAGSDAYGFPFARFRVVYDPGIPLTDFENSEFADLHPIPRRQRRCDPVEHSLDEGVDIPLV